MVLNERNGGFGDISSCDEKNYSLFTAVQFQIADILDFKLFQSYHTKANSPERGFVVFGSNF